MPGIDAATGPVTRASINEDAGTSHTLVAAQGANQVIRMLAFELFLGSSQTMEFRSGTTPITGIRPAASSWQSPQVDDNGRFQTNANEALNLNLGGSATVDGYIVYQVIQG